MYKIRVTNDLAIEACWQRNDIHTYNDNCLH